MKTKISMKTIYLILVITIGLVGLGIGSTLAVFTASAEISNPISFSSNLSYNGDIFDTVEVTIGPNATRTTNVSIFNDEQIDGVKYAVWYIYEGNSNDISFVRNQESDIDPSGTDIGQGGTLSMDIKNNTSNTITITIGVTTSKEDIVLPSYMKVITLATVAKYNLTLNKGTGISIMYYKINGSNTYASTTNSSITVSVNEGSTYYYYGIASTGYAMNSCSSSSSPCSGTMGASAVTKTLTASRKTYTISYNANGGTGAPSSQTKTYGITLTLSNTKPVKIGYPFLGWTINSNGTGTLYQPGGSFTTNANTTLYAKYSTTLTNYTVYLDVIDTGESYQNTVKHGDEYSKDISTMASGVDVTCTNGQIPNISGPYNNIVTIYINQVTSNTSCEVQWWDY
jgi:predicted ribosomally synthesized peptide with SipW-like signal peptide